MGSEASSFNPVSASPAESVLKPSSPRFSSSSRRILASSSMMRMVGIRLAHVGTGARMGTGALARPSRAQLGSCMRLDGFFKRKEKREHSAAPRSVLDTNRPMMPVHNLRNNRKPQSHAGFLRGHKRIENLFAQFFGNARTSVGQAKFHSLPIVLRSALNFDTQPAAVVSVLHGFVGILHKIEEGLFAQAFVERNERQPARVVALNPHGFARLLFSRRLLANKLASKAIRDNLQNAIEKRDQIRGMRFGMKRASKVEKLCDE